MLHDHPIAVEARASVQTVEACQLLCDATWGCNSFDYCWSSTNSSPACSLFQDDHVEDDPSDTTSSAPGAPCASHYLVNCAPSVGGFYRYFADGALSTELFVDPHAQNLNATVPFHLGPDGCEFYGQPGVDCLDACNYLSDDDCDDGGPGSEYSECTLGTDCADCGPRGTWVRGGCFGDFKYFAAWADSGCNGQPAFESNGRHCYSPTFTLDQYVGDGTDQISCGTTGPWRFSPLTTAVATIDCDEPDPPRIKRLRVSGFACKVNASCTDANCSLSDVGASQNQIYAFNGTTADGRPFYVGETDPTAYIYYDRRCGRTHRMLSKWVLKTGWVVNTVSDVNLDGDEDHCSVNTSFVLGGDRNSGENSPRGVQDVWELLRTHNTLGWCGAAGEGHVNQNMAITIDEPPAECGSVELSGISCTNGLGEHANQIYEYVGRTRDGRPYYRGRWDDSLHLFYDSNCGGELLA